MRKELAFVFLRALSFFLFVGLVTYFVIYLLTPRPQELIFDFSCLNTKSVCPISVDNERRIEMEEKINDAVRSSRRLGSLSEVYLSIMRFSLRIRNVSEGYIVIPAKESTTPVVGNVMCIIGTKERTFPYDTEILIDDDFFLSDSANEIVTATINFISLCPGFSFSHNKPIPDIPPNSEVRFDIGPRFQPIFEVDKWTCFITYLFNFIVLLGLLPLLREGWRFIKRGRNYFQN